MARRQQRQQHPAVQLALDGGGAATAVAHSAAGDRAAACSHASGQVRAWAVSPAGGELAPLHDARVPGGPRVLAWAPAEHGSVLAVGTGAGTLHFLAAGAGGGEGGGWSDSGALPCGRGAVTDAAFAPWQLGLLLAASSADGHVYVYEGSPGAPMTPSPSSSSPSEGGRPLNWTLHSRFAAAQPTAAAAAAALLPSAAAPSPCGCVAWRGGSGSGGSSSSSLPPLLLAGSGPGRAAGVWAYDAGAMSWRRAVALDPPLAAAAEGAGASASAAQEDGRSPHYPATARACAWAPSLGRADELVAVALGGGCGDVALYRLPLLSPGAGGGDEGRWPARLAPAQTLRHVWQGGVPLSAWRLSFNATGTALAASVEEEKGGIARGVTDDMGPPPQVWFWMPNLESGVWRAVANVEGGGFVGVGGLDDDSDDDDDDEEEGGGRPMRLLEY